MRSVRGNFLGAGSGSCCHCEFVGTTMPLNLFNGTYTQRHWEILSIIRTVFDGK